MYNGMDIKLVDIDLQFYCNWQTNANSTKQIGIIFNNKSIEIIYNACHLFACAVAIIKLLLIITVLKL